MFKRGRKVSRDGGSGRPYMPTPDQFVSALDDNGQSAPSSSALKPPKHRQPRRIWARTVLGVIIAVIIATLGYGFYLAHNLSGISTQPLDLTGLSADSAGRTNVLVLGEGDPGHAGEGLTDTMMVISYDASSKRIAQISIPRDLRVDIEGFGYGKINSANADGGVKLAEQTVASTLGIPINYYVQTDFTGLKQLVDAVGGIDVDVKTALVDTEYPCDDNQYKVCGLDIEPGLQHMDGTTALQYARCRKGTCGNDFGRAERQQEVLSLVRQKLTKWQTLVNPAKLAPITAALRTSLKTDMGAVQMAQFGLDWQKAQANSSIQLVFSTATGGYLVTAGGSSDLLPADGTFAAIQDRVQNIFTEPTRATDVPQD